jgi:hypothetical protein
MDKKFEDIVVREIYRAAATNVIHAMDVAMMVTTQKLSKCKSMKEVADCLAVLRDSVKGEESDE